MKIFEEAVIRLVLSNTHKIFIDHLHVQDCTKGW